MMHITIIRSEGVRSLRSFERILTKRKISYEIESTESDPVWSSSGKDLDRAWVSDYAAAIYKRKIESTDAIIIFIDEDEWAARGLRGRHYITSYSGYRVAFVKYDRMYARTAEHEVMHMLNDIVFITLGIRLETVVGVADWDDGVVHGEDPRFTRYEYDTPYDMVYEYVKKAAETRRRVWALSMLKKIEIALRSLLLTLQKRDHVITDEDPETNADRLYQVTLDSVGMDVSPSDLAPDELGCAETLSNLIKMVRPEFRIITGTWTLWDLLRKSPDFTLVESPQSGDIIISPTGTSSKGSRAPFPGHTGIVGNRGKVYSNDSYDDGKLKQNFTLDGWRERYQERGGYPIYYFRIK